MYWAIVCGAKKGGMTLKRADALLACMEKRIPNANGKEEHHIAEVFSVESKQSHGLAISISATSFASPSGETMLPTNYVWSTSQGQIVVIFRTHENMNPSLRSVRTMFAKAYAPYSLRDLTKRDLDLRFLVLCLPNEQLPGDSPYYTRISFSIL